ncbi:MAG: polysaccharide deacetylase family protein [Streptosporangiaceae bacterium]|jgi:peptidoglycan/xylan/chitin deacetylase (PgdA/CDA1 family)
MDARGRASAPVRAGAYGARPRPTQRQFWFRRFMVLGVPLTLVAVIAGCLGPSGPAPVPLNLAWTLSPASNSVTVRVTAPSGPSGRQVLAHSQVAVSGNDGHWSAAGGTVRVPVPAGVRTTLVIRLTGPQQLNKTITVSAPQPPRIVESGASSGEWLIYTSSPLRSGPAQVLCGTGKVSFAAPTQVVVPEGATACHARLQLTAQDGEHAAVPVTIPALAKPTSLARPENPARPATPLYCFADPAGRAIYITVDDGWTPSQQVLTLMHHNYLPITAFLIADAAKENLSYWKKFAAAGGIIGDHTVSHPYLTEVSLTQATTQWKQARMDLGHWLNQTPAIGRPPYGAFNGTTEVAAARAGLTALAGWSATMSGNSIQTWNDKPLSPGEIVILHWVPGLGQQLTVLLKEILALHLNPTPLTVASFSGIAPQQRSLGGD